MIKKRIIAVLISLSLIMTLISTVVLAAPNEQFVDGDFKYTVLTEPSGDKNGTVELSKSSSTVAEMALDTITHDEKTYDITAIGDYAFERNNVLSIITMLKIEKIGYGAFSECTALKNVFLPIAETVGPQSFYGCTSLESAALYKVKKIAEYSFMNCSILKAIAFPEATEIGTCAFSNCSSIQNVNQSKV